jgi:hypothetical protein
MSDITLNTRRFTNASGFDGASRNDLLRIAAQALDYAGEAGDPKESNVLLNLRWENEDIDSDDNEFRFDYDGGTYVIMTEESFDARVEAEIESHIEDAEYEFTRQLKDSSYVSPYVKFDTEAFTRDLKMDLGSLVGHYDGQYHEMYCSEYTSGDGNIVTRRETLVMIRED